MGRGGQHQASFAHGEIHNITLRCSWDQLPLSRGETERALAPVSAIALIASSTFFSSPAAYPSSSAACVSLQVGPATQV